MVILSWRCFRLGEDPLFERRRDAATDYLRRIIRLPLKLISDCCADARAVIS